MREALLDLQRYLSDRVAPLMIVDSIETMLAAPPQVAANTIESWAISQRVGQDSDATISDFLFHALKKIQLMSQLQLIEAERIDRYLQDLGGIVAELCPEEDREQFKSTLQRLGESSVEAMAPLELLHRGAGTGSRWGMQGPGRASPPRQRTAGAASTGESDQVARGLERFTRLMERLERSSKATGGDDALLPHLASAMALGSSSGADLEERMKQLGRLGLEGGTEELFRALGRSLPGWILSTSAETAAPTSHRVEAMRRLIKMAPDAGEGMKRYSEMVRAAIEQFNEGSLVQAGTMLELAEEIAAGKILNPDGIGSVKRNTQDLLSEDRLGQYAKETEKQASLRKVMEFFPKLTATGLLAALEEESGRSQRKQIIGLLEIHGERARAAALERLGSCVSGDVAEGEPFFLRNLVFLLRRVPRQDDASPEVEIALLQVLSRLGNPAVVIKEALGAMGQIRVREAERILMERLSEFEESLLRQKALPDDVEEIWSLLDRVTATLARFSTPNTLRSVANHALRSEPQLGNTAARLEPLGAQDLSSDRGLVEHLVARLRSELPRKMLGFVVNKRNEAVASLIKGLSGTPAPAVRQVLQEIVERFAGQEFASTAAQVLSGLGAGSAGASPKVKAAASQEAKSRTKGLSGDVGLFGLPMLLQTIADNRMTGRLHLSDEHGDGLGILEFEGGGVLECRTGRLTGEMAFYQLFETPVAGTFVFDSSSTPGPEGTGKKDGREVTSMLFEAMRRHDEFQQSRALVPDDLKVGPTGQKPSPPAEEEDQAFLQALWSNVIAGTTPARCETAIDSDSFRIRRALAHWLEEGALQAC